jgi:hypothetical protein
MAWRKRLASATGSTLPAESLYCGDHWHVVRSLTHVAKQRSLDLRVFVCSAGYGLVPAIAPVHSYAATFSPGSPDSITRSVTNGEASAARRTWWREMAQWEGPSPGYPRSIEQLLSVHKYRALLIAVSPPYLDAIAEDLASGTASTGPDRVAIFSAGTGSHSLFSENLIPCDARLQRLLGGARASLNVRCLRYAIERLPADKLTVPDLHRYFARLLARQPDLPSLARTALVDEEVVTFIRGALRRSPAPRPTPLLRELRDSCCACKQSRFSALFRRVVKEGSHG